MLTDMVHVLTGLVPVPVQGETWQAVIQGHEVDPMSQQQDQQRLLLERFQREVSRVVIIAGMTIILPVLSSTSQCAGIFGP